MSPLASQTRADLIMIVGVTTTSRHLTGPAIMTSFRIFVLTSLFLFIAIPVLAQDVALNVGDEMPPFSAETAEGTIWNSADHVGDGLLVVYFYPEIGRASCR